MEQRIGSSSQPLEGEPLKGAGFDPAFIPGLTSPLSTQPGVTGSKDTGPRDAEPEDEPADTAPEESAPEESAPEESAPEEAADVTDVEAEASSDATGAPEEEPAVDGPVFEAADRRARIVADAQGIRLSLDDQACEFRWDEIGAVETETARFGKRFTVTVHTPDRRWFPIEIEAKARASFKEWETELDAVLDAYFEDGDPEKADAVEAAEEAEAVSESESESAKDKADEGKTEADKTEADKAEADKVEDTDGDDVKKDESAATKS
ncbi:hypothetical protein FNH09_40150 [Streptomyces adustus]|uniref:Uncharacterized protein n=1 Tax=Streptomyces adustus TaxID=1609272 RepID=A0A5N8VQY7_9ACTN|nr:hypothetical protein [Streptomyces adustus]